MAILGTDGKVPSSQLPPGTGGGGINVIDYEPSDYQELNLATLEDFIPLNGDNWNAELGELVVGSYPQPYTPRGDNPSGIDISSEYVAIKLPNIPNTGSFTIDVSQCSNDMWGIVGLPSTSTGIILQEYLASYHFKWINAGYGATQAFQSSAFSGWAFAEYGSQYPTPPDGYGIRVRTGDTQDSNLQSTMELTKLYPTYTLHVGTELDAYMALTGMTEQELIDGFGEEFINLARSNRMMWCQTPDSELVGIWILSDMTELYFFITPYYLGDAYYTEDTVLTLDPTSKVSISLDELGVKSNFLPPEAQDGDYLKILNNADIFNKSIIKNSFVIPFRNKSEIMIIKP